MAGVIHNAATRINAGVAGLTGIQTSPLQEPGAPQPASPTEFLDTFPTEFGGLTHLFGGGGATVEGLSQYAPVNSHTMIPSGSVRGPLGGLVPDVRNTAGAATAQARRVSEPLAVSVRNTIAKARAALKI